MASSKFLLPLPLTDVTLSWFGQDRQERRRPCSALHRMARCTIPCTKSRGLTFVIPADFSTTNIASTQPRNLLKYSRVGTHGQSQPCVLCSWGSSAR